MNMLFIFLKLPYRLVASQWRRERERQMKKAIIISSFSAGLAATAVATAPQTAQAQTRIRPSSDFFDFGNMSLDQFWQSFAQYLAHILEGGRPGDFNQPNVVDLPTAFALTGDCNLRSPCHLDQDGENFKITCRPSTRSPYQFEGSITGRRGKRLTFDALSFDQDTGEALPSPFRCNARLTRRGWVGTCQDLATPDEPNPSTEQCAIELNESPAPLVYAEQLPSYVDGFTACGMSYSDCETIQDGTSARLRCKDSNNEDAYFSGTLRGNALSVDITNGDDRYRCTADYNNAPTTGVCTQRLPRDSEETPLTCDDFAFDATPVEIAHGTCDNSLPTSFKLDGCGLEGACQAVQRGCEWQVTCGDDTFSGRSNGRNYKFDNAAGQRCTLRVDESGEVRGNCRSNGAAERCLIREVDVAPVDETQCFQMPSVITTAGCGLFADCNVIQDGCMVQASCRNGEFGFTADVTTSNISFEGIGDFTCSADLVDEDGKQRLLGYCTAPDGEGGVRGCREVFGEGQPTLQLDWEQ